MDARERMSLAHSGARVPLNHPIFARWPARYPDRLQLFSLPTPNGVKISIMFEETGLEYEPHRVDIMAGENHDPAFLALNPNGKIPAIYDPQGPRRQAARAVRIGCASCSILRTRQDDGV